VTGEANLCSVHMKAHIKKSVVKVNVITFLKSEKSLGLFLQVKNISSNNLNEILQRRIKLEH